MESMPLPRTIAAAWSYASDDARRAGASARDQELARRYFHLGTEFMALAVEEILDSPDADDVQTERLVALMREARGVDGP